MVWDEAKIARQRINQRIRTDATVMYRAVGAAFAGGTEAAKELNVFLSESFNDGSEDF